MGQIKDGDTIKGNQVRVKVVKNKVAPPFKKAEFDLMFNEGISRIGEILDFAVATEVIKKSGSFFSYGDTKLGQGRDKVKDVLADNPDLCEELEAKIGEQIKGNQVRVKVVKNKVAPPFKKAEFDLMFNEGISRVGEILDFAVATELIKKSGSFFSYGDTKLGQGRDKVKDVLAENPDLCDELEAKINEKVKELGLEAVLSKIGK